MKTLGRITALALAASLIALLGVPAATAIGGGGNGRTYSVSMTNVTENQILTPAAFAAHTHKADVFDVGAPASKGIQEIAENGNLAPLADALKTAKGVQASGIGTGGVDGPLFPGDSRTFEFKAPSFARLFSAAGMVVCTNDGFTGLDSVQLPRKKGETVRVYAFAWDAGTEKNTNDLDDFVPPCSGGKTGTGMSNPALAEGGVIAPHPGLGGEVAAMWGFDSDAPVAVFELTRT